MTSHLCLPHALKTIQGHHQLAVNWWHFPPPPAKTHETPWQESIWEHKNGGWRKGTLFLHGFSQSHNVLKLILFTWKNIQFDPEQYGITYKTVFIFTKDLSGQYVSWSLNTLVVFGTSGTVYSPELPKFYKNLPSPLPGQAFWLV